MLTEMSFVGATIDSPINPIPKTRSITPAIEMPGNVYATSLGKRAEYKGKMMRGKLGA